MSLAIDISPNTGVTATLSGAGYITGRLSENAGPIASVGYRERIIPANTIFIYKGYVATIDELPVDASYGDTYSVTAEESYFAWNGEEWNNIGAGTMVEELTQSEIDDLVDLLD